MSEVGLVSLVSLVGWLILVLGAYRAHRVGMQRTIVMILIWGAILLFLTMVFTAIGW
jgi:hypothetical protein